MTWNDKLTGTHLQIASFSGTPLRVIAGPGTGKTYALMRRIARFLEEGISPESILAVSFTRTAANDLVDKLSKLGVTGASSVVAKTLHSLSFKLLNEQDVFKATNRIPRPLLQFEIDCLVSDLAISFGGRDATNDLLKAFEAYWARLQHLEPGWPKDKRDEHFQRELKNWLIFHECILVGELVPLAIDFIEQNPASPLVPKYSQVLADEYQDLNRADQKLIDQLAATGQLTVVGDEDQSIYSFRHAHPEGIAKFNEGRTGTHDEQLDVCLRCPQKVIDMAKTLIQNNPRTKTGTITSSASNPQGEVYIVQHGNFREESINLSTFVDWYLKKNPEVKPGEVLVLVTRRLLGYAIRDELIGLGRAAQSFFNEECLESLSAKEGFCLLNLLVKPNDKSALRAWMGIDTQGRRSKPYKRLTELSNADGVTPKEYLESTLSGQKKIPYAGDIVQRYKDLKQRLAILTNLKEIAELIDALWPANDQTCTEIRSLAIALSQFVTNPSDLLEQLVTTITQPVLPGEDDGIIRVMSLHKSKGLTAKCVIVAGCVAGALPRVKPGLAETERKKVIEEQRRLFYVALTRTTRTLVISSSATVPFKDAMAMNLTNVKKAGSTAILQASPFLNELGNHGVETLSGIAWKKKIGF